jgi:3-deoxy-D-manno-octulosonic acid kinase
MIQTQHQTMPDGAILFDPIVIAQAGQSKSSWFDPLWFDAQHWRDQDRAEAASAGRGSALYIDAPFGRCVLRHYRRGGLVAKMMDDRYLWAGADRTRAFAEFRLLVDLHGRGLRVPAPLGARYQRKGPHYRADLITRRIENAETLAALVAVDRCNTEVAARVGCALADLHAAGAYHADLNAHNILLTSDAVWVVDFDRGELRTPAQAWQASNLARLRRSLIKVGAANDGEEKFDRILWKALTSAYQQHLGELVDRSAGSARA